MRTRRTTAAVLTAAAAAALAISGCGGDGEGEPKDNEPGAEIAKPPSEETEVRAQFEELVADVLAERGLDTATIDCALDQLDEAVSDTEIEAATDEIRQTGVPPPGVIEAAAAAGEACGGA